MEKLKQLNKQKYAYEMIRAKIMNAEYPPGFRLVVSTIAKDLDLSTIPVREALHQLKAESIVKFESNRGAKVSIIDEKDYTETLTIIAILEGYATAASAVHFPHEKLAELTKMNEKMKGSLEEYDFATYGVLNRQFHYLTYTYCENDLLINEIKKHWHKLDTLRSMGSTFMPKRANESMEEHNVIIEMIRENRSFSEINDYVREHKLKTVKIFKEKNN